MRCEKCDFTLMMCQCPEDADSRTNRLLNLERPMELTTTHRGFAYGEFTDRYDAVCSLQMSSLASEPAIWLGVNDADPKIMASKVMENGTGWVKYPLHEDVSLNTRMHLTQDQAAELIPHLQKFVETGEI